MFFIPAIATGIAGYRAVDRLSGDPVEEFVGPVWDEAWDRAVDGSSGWLLDWAIGDFELGPEARYGLTVGSTVLAIGAGVVLDQLFLDGSIRKLVRATFVGE